MANLKRKAINFDLDTKELKKIFSDYTTAYSKLKASFAKNGFEHRQGSGYVSVDFLADVKTGRIINKVIAENEWLKVCAKKFDVTEIGDTYDLMKMIKSFKPKQNSPTTKEARRDDDEQERD